MAWPNGFCSGDAPVAFSCCWSTCANVMSGMAAISVTHQPLEDMGVLLGWTARRPEYAGRIVRLQITKTCTASYPYGGCASRARLWRGCRTCGGISSRLSGHWYSATSAEVGLGGGRRPSKPHLSRSAPASGLPIRLRRQHLHLGGVDDLNSRDGWARRQLG